MSRQAVIKIIDRKKWHGIDSKDFPAQPTTHQADVHEGLWQIRLSEAEIKELKSKGVDVSSRIFNQAEAHPVFDNPLYMPTLNDGTTIFNLDDPSDLVKFGIAKGLSVVAGSKADADENGNFLYYIFSQGEEEQSKAKKFEDIQSAYIKLSKLNVQQKKDIALILLGKEVKNDVEINAAFDDIFKTQLEEFMMYSEQSTDLVAMKALASRAINKLYIQKKDGKYVYGDIEMGFNIEDITQYLGKNQELADVLMRKLNDQLIFSDESKRDALANKTKGKSSGQSKETES